MPAVLDRRVSKAEAKKLDRVLQPFEQGGRYVAQHFDALLEKYGDGWIAARGNKIVAHSRTRLGLRRKLTSKRLRPTQAYTTYLTRTRRTLIL